jgi:hypothetical protein
MRELVDDFRRTVDDASERLLAISDAESASRSGPEDWSPKEIIGHLIDSATNNHRRFVLGQINDGLDFESYAQDDWVRVNGYRDAPWSDLVALWRQYNLHLAHVMLRTPEEKLRQEHRLHTLDRIAFNQVDSGRPATLEYLMRDYVDHLKHHLAQILGQ